MFPGSLHDYFAAQALTALIIRHECVPPGCDDDSSREDICAGWAFLSFKYAEAMVEKGAKFRPILPKPPRSHRNEFVIQNSNGEYASRFGAVRPYTTVLDLAKRYRTLKQAADASVDGEVVRRFSDCIGARHVSVG